jgi:hypothetical protein
MEKTLDEQINSEKRYKQRTKAELKTQRMNNNHLLISFLFY